MSAIRLILVLTTVLVAPLAVQGQSRAVPPPAVDEPAGQGKTEVAVLAGGCFWGVQGVYQHVKGVTSAVSGYARGPQSEPAEAVQITFDPKQISYGRLLHLFFAVVHDPTQLNRQGPDEGPEYRSAIFPANAEQEKVARAYIAQLNQAKVFRSAVVTKIETGSKFARAEDFHQDYFEKNPTSPYIAINDLPKLQQLKQLFPDSYRATPVLVGGK